MNQDDIEKFLKLQPKLKIIHTEMSLLSKKSPNEPLNKFKLKFINNLIETANEILGEYKPFEDFEVFSDDDLPTNSDVVFIISPYLRSLEKLRCDNISEDSMYHWYWMIDGVQTSMATDGATIR